jgi:flagellar export protein FliJ
VTQFQFRLQNILRLRERERDAAAKAYKEATTAKEKLLNQVEQLMQEYSDQHPVQASSNTGHVNPQRLIESQRYQMHLLQQVHHLRSQIELVDAECEKRRLTLLKKEQNLSSLEKLRESNLAEWNLQLGQREQIALDQWAGFQYWKG